MRLFSRDSWERMGVTTRSVPSERKPRVKLHRNAKATPHMRALLVSRVRVQHWCASTAAAAAGVSVRMAYKGLARHRVEGRPALKDHSSTPHRQPRRGPSRAAAPAALFVTDAFSEFCQGYCRGRQTLNLR